MLQAKITAKEKVELLDVPEPSPGAGMVKVKISACGICGSDLEEYLYFGEVPSVFGHEFSGVVVETGSGVEKVKVGDPVAVYAYEALGFSQYTVVEEFRCIPLPDGFEIKAAALAEPIVVVLTGLRYCDFRVGDTCYVSGCGTIGLLGVQLLRAFGARRIIAANRSEFRRLKAAELGADLILDPTAHDIIEIKELVRGAAGAKVNFALECTGVGSSMRICRNVLKVGGTLCVLGLNPMQMNLSTFDLFISKFDKKHKHEDDDIDEGLSATKIQGVTPFDIRLFEVAIRLMQDGKIDPTKIVTHSFGLENIADAFTLSADRSAETVKIMVTMD